MKQTSFAFGEAERKNEQRMMRAAYSVEYCFSVIGKDQYLWDMRCWHHYHDRDEVLAWVSGNVRQDSKNAGHCALCIEALKAHGISLEEIADAVLRNNHIQYKNRIVACWHTPENCRKYRHQGNYGNNICRGCTNEGNDDNAV